MKDIFEHQVLCRNCHRTMKPFSFVKNGFELRALKCTECNDRIIHPGDLKDYETFSHLKDKIFKVKLRLVGNSYAVSIPKEIVDFIKEQEIIVDNIVKLAFEDFDKIYLKFN